MKGAFETFVIGAVGALFGIWSDKYREFGVMATIFWTGFGGAIGLMFCRYVIRNFAKLIDRKIDIFGLLYESTFWLFSLFISYEFYLEDEFGQDTISVLTSWIIIAFLAFLLKYIFYLGGEKHALEYPIGASLLVAIFFLFLLPAFSAILIPMGAGRLDVYLYFQTMAYHSYFLFILYFVVGIILLFSN